MGKLGMKRLEADSSRGAALVETALVLVLLIMVLVGIVNAAVALGRNNSLHNASREASRFAATLPEVASNLDAVHDTAVAAALGDLDAGVPGRYICIAHIDPSGMSSVLINDAPSAASECFDDGLTGADDIERVQVVTGRTTTLNAVIFSTDIDLRSEAVAQYERGGGP